MSLKIDHRVQIKMKTTILKDSRPDVMEATASMQFHFQDFEIMF